MKTIEGLTALGPRWTGMPGDERAAGRIATELRDAGRDAQLEDLRLRPAYHLTHALHAALGALGSVVSAVVSEPLGLLLLLVTAISMYGDLTARFYIARLLMPRRPAQNVTSRGARPDAPIRVVLTAHHDAARTGLLYWRPGRRNRRNRPPAEDQDRGGRTKASARSRQARPLRASNLAGPVDLAFWTLCIALVAAAVRLITGSDSTLMSVSQFIPTVILLVFVTLFADAAMSPVAAGANGNASGVATLLELARRLERRNTEAVDVWLVFPAGKEGFMLGMRAWMRAHGAELDPRYTFFVNVDSVGAGTMHHVTGEGFALMYRHDPNLIRICSEIGSRPRTWRGGTDGVLPAMQGYPSVTLCCVDQRGRIANHKRPSDVLANVDPQAVDASVEFVEELVRRIDVVVRRRGEERVPTTDSES